MPSAPPLCPHFCGPRGVAPCHRPLLCRRRSRWRSKRPSSGEASGGASRWRKPRCALLGGNRAGGLLPAPLPLPAPPGPCLTPGSRAGGSVADRTEGSEPPGHLQAEGEVGTRGHGSRCPARWGQGGSRGGGGSINTRDCHIHTPLYLGSFRFLIFCKRDVLMLERNPAWLPAVPPGCSRA